MSTEQDRMGSQQSNDHATSQGDRPLSKSLTGIFSEYFGIDGAEVRNGLEPGLTLRQLYSGEILFHQGDPGETLAVVLSGRLRVALTGSDGSSRVVDEHSRGAVVGELALLTGEPRTATVFAVRDSEVLLVNEQAFLRLLQRHPQALHQLAATAAGRARHALSGAVAPETVLTVALIPCGPGAPIAPAARQLATAFAALGETMHLSSGTVDQLLDEPGVAQAGEGSEGDGRLRRWLSVQEERCRWVVLEADSDWSPWTRRCLRLADRVLLVGNADSSPEPGSLERLLPTLALSARTELLLVHPNETARPRGTAAWLEARTVAAHHHARPGYSADWRRLARRLGGNAAGLVLSSGGARGFAHIGAIQALTEQGVEIDYYGGTSMGALGAGLAALGFTSEELRRAAAAFGSRKQLLDYTLPLTSFVAGRRVSALFRELFGDAQIEDLWTPFFCLSSNVSRAVPVIHERGPLWRAVRASTAIPGIFAPVLHEGDVLVDGAVLNSLPIDVMRERCERGQVIGVNACPPLDASRRYMFGDSVSGWQVLWSRLTRGKALRAPSLFGVLMRTNELSSCYRLTDPSFRKLASVIIDLPLSGFKSLEFDKHEAIIEAGLVAARAQMALLTRAGERQRDSTELMHADAATAAA